MEIKERVKEFKKELVLKKVSQFFEKNGFNEAKMVDIASFCNISVGALYKLFPSKDELFYEYVNYQINQFYEKLKKGFENFEKCEDRLKYFIRLKFETFLEKKEILKDTVAGDPLFFTKLNANKGNPAQKVYKIVAEEFEKLNKKTPLKTEDFEKIAFLFNSFTYGYIEFWLIYNKDIMKYIEEAYDIFIKGIIK